MKQMLKEFPDNSTVHRTFQRWVDLGMLDRIWAALVEECEELGRVNWEWQAVDGALGKGRFWGLPQPQSHRPRQEQGKTLPSGRGRRRSAFDNLRRRQRARRQAPCRDDSRGRGARAARGHRGDAPASLLGKGLRQPTEQGGRGRAKLRAHIRRIGEEKVDVAGEKRYPARRWVVERTLGWLSKCRAVFVRYEEKAANYLGLVKLACIMRWYRRLCQEAGSNRSRTV